MADWKKTIVSKTDVDNLVKKYNLDPLSASICVRRGITNGNDMLFYKEDDLRFQHNPFLFNGMEDVVDRLLAAKDENEKVLIFGDRDVDGVTSTTVLYEEFKALGLDVSFRLPQGDDAYGLSMEAVDDFAKQFGSLIVTVDCGISNVNEIKHANELGIDVIVLDHHNPPEIVPEAEVILDAKMENSGYPFKDISGCAVAYKVVSALRFSHSEWYKLDVTLLNVEEIENGFSLNCIKLRNLVPLSVYNERITESNFSAVKNKFFEYLKGQLILVWDKKRNQNLLKEIFGSAQEFNLVDIQEEFSKINSSIASLSLSQLKSKSTLAKYGNHSPTEIGAFFNIFVTYVQYTVKKLIPDYVEKENNDLQLVALAALADIMPMKNENRIFVKYGIKMINEHKIRSGLFELMSVLHLTEKKVSSIDLSWVIVSNLNAAGRMGQSELAANLFLNNNPVERSNIANKIVELNTLRKTLTSDAQGYSSLQGETSINQYNGNLCVVIDPRIHRGVSGILAGKLASTFDVPAMVMTYVDDLCIGSMRSCRGLDLPQFLSQMSDLFVSYGGHKAAAGFSFKKNQLDEFQNRLKELSKNIVLTESEKNTYTVDAEVPQKFLTPNLLKINDLFEPFGEENAQLLFMSKNLEVKEIQALGKEMQHLKFSVEGNACKWPCLYWNKGSSFRTEYNNGDRVDILYRVEKNLFNKMEIPQIVIVDMKKSENW